MAGKNTILLVQEDHYRIMCQQIIFYILIRKIIDSNLLL